jgi:GT2 family glycosyltransferase
MKASVIIPVWNGAEVIRQCLAALLASPADLLLEVICVENASRDESARVIASRFPQVKLLRQPVNLGFAGGINVGIHAAQGDTAVLLNQDCVPQPGWLAALAAAFEADSTFGIAGCTIYFADGRLDHAGARMMRPGAFGEHLTEVGSRPRVTDYVTGAAMAIRRLVFEAVGYFDEGFYPAYYEECDFCYRAREHGFEIAYVPAAKITHLRSSREAQADWLKHWANQQKARYRFVIKQFDLQELSAFIAFELKAMDTEPNFDRAVGSVIAARDTLHALPDIVERRRIDRNDELPPVGRRQLEVGLAAILRRALARADQLNSSRARHGTDDQAKRGPLGQLAAQVRRAASPGPDQEMDRLKQELAELRDEFDRRLSILEILAEYDFR